MFIPSQKSCLFSLQQNLEFSLKFLSFFLSLPLQSPLCVSLFLILYSLFSVVLQFTTASSFFLKATNNVGLGKSPGPLLAFMLGLTTAAFLYKPSFALFLMSHHQWFSDVCAPLSLLRQSLIVLFWLLKPSPAF